MPRGLPPNRCTECNKIIRQENKSGLCNFHYKKMRRKRNNPTTKLAYMVNDK